MRFFFFLYSLQNSDRVNVLTTEMLCRNDHDLLYEKTKQTVSSYLLIFGLNILEQMYA